MKLSALIPFSSRRRKPGANTTRDCDVDLTTMDPSPHLIRVASLAADAILENTPDKMRITEHAFSSPHHVHFDDRNDVMDLEPAEPSMAIQDRQAHTTLASKKHLKVYTHEDLYSLAEFVESDPTSKKFLLPSGKWFTTVHLLSNSNDAPLSHRVKSHLVYKKNERAIGKCIAAVEEDAVVLMVMEQHLTSMRQPPSRGRAMYNEARDFVIKNFHISWDAFYERNETKIANATGYFMSGSADQSASNHFASSVQSLSARFGEMGDTHSKTLLKISSDSKEAHIANGIVFKEALQQVSSDHKEAHIANGIVFKEALQQMSGDNKANTEVLHALVKMIATERKPRRAPAASTLIPMTPLSTTMRPKVATTVSKARRARPIPVEDLRIPASPLRVPSTSNKRPKVATTVSKARRTPATKAPPVRRILLEGGLPLNQKGEECGHCRNLWRNKFTFCTSHDAALDSMTQIAED